MMANEQQAETQNTLHLCGSIISYVLLRSDTAAWKGWHSGRYRF